MEIKNKRLFTVILAMTMIALFTAIYFAASSFFVSAAGGAPVIDDSVKSFESVAKANIIQFKATDTNLASATSMSPATPTNTFTWSLSNITPNANIIINPNDGWLSAVGVAVGTYNFKVIATNSVGIGELAFTLKIISSDGGGSPSGPPSGSTDPKPGGSVVQYTLTFVTNGGSEIAPVKGYEGTSISLKPYKTVREGYNFVGWFSDKELTKPIKTVIFIGDVSVYAKWEEIGADPGDIDVDVIPGGEKDRPSKNYVDVDPTMWYIDYIDFVIANGLMTGVSTEPLRFAPNANLTRAMMVQILYNMEGRPSISSDVIFGDVPAGSWFFDAIAWSYANSIVLGYPSGNFGPNDFVTREQMVTILYRYSQFKGYDTTPSADIDSFADAADVSDWAVEAMQWAVGSGLIVGRGANNIAPKATATRAEVATVITRFCNTVVGTVMPAADAEDEDEPEDTEDGEDVKEEG